MASTAPSTYLAPLDVPHEREGIGRELELVLHELVNLSLIGQQLHWAVFGPLSRPVHLQLAGLVDSWRGLADTVTERALAPGFVPDGQARAMEKHAAQSRWSAVATDSPTKTSVRVDRSMIRVHRSRCADSRAITWAAGGPEPLGFVRVGRAAHWCVSAAA